MIRKLPGEVSTEAEGDEAEEAKGGIDDAPAKGNVTKGSHDEGKKNYHEAGDDSKFDDPDVSNRIAEGADEGDSDYKMRKGKPIGAVGEEREACVGFDEAAVNGVQPVRESRSGAGLGGKEAGGEVEFGLERDGGQAAEEEGGDEKSEQDTNATNENGAGLGHGWNVAR